MNRGSGAAILNADAISWRSLKCDEISILGERSGVGLDSANVLKVNTYIEGYLR